MTGKVAIQETSLCLSETSYRGVGLVSRLATYHADRFKGIVPISVSYLEPGLVWDIGAFRSILKLRHSLIALDQFIDLTQSAFGYATYGYWKWHNTEEAVKTCDENVSFCSQALLIRAPNSTYTSPGQSFLSCIPPIQNSGRQILVRLEKQPPLSAVVELPNHQNGSPRPNKPFVTKSYQRGGIEVL